MNSCVWSVLTARAPTQAATEVTQPIPTVGRNDPCTSRPSAIAQWFVQRTEGQNGRTKRIMIVAVARKLAIALWRYLEQGLVPQGAVLTR